MTFLIILYFIFSPFYPYEKCGQHHHMNYFIKLLRALIQLILVEFNIFYKGIYTKKKKNDSQRGDCSHAA